MHEIYLDVNDRVNEAENGTMSFSRFNRYSWLAQLRLIDWLSGDVSGIAPPRPYLTQKNKDWLSFLITKKLDHAVGGSIAKPADYYQWDNGVKLGAKLNADCEEEEGKTENCNTPIELLDGTNFDTRCNTYIDELKPSLTKPIAKLIGSTIEFLPSDIGSVKIEYIRYPKKAILGSKNDPIHNQPVYDSATSTNFEWPEFAREILVWFIVNSFSDFTREQALKTTNTLTGKTIRDAR